MEKLLFTFITIFTAQLLVAQVVNIPDINFKQALLQHHPVIDTNGDGEIQITEALAATNIFVHNKNISNLTGIEEFINLEELVCSSNPINTIDISSNPELAQLVVGSTNLNSLDISQNINLYTLFINDTAITEIDTANNPKLEFMDGGYGSLSTVDFLNNPNLKILSLENTNIQTLDISANSLLEVLGIYGTVIDNLDFSLLPNLKVVNLGNNNISTIDFSQNPNLCSVFIANCPDLEYINLKNGNNEILVANIDCSVNVTYGGLSSPSGLNAITNNQNLQTICVDNITFAQQNFTLVPPQTQFTEVCNLDTPDNKFTQFQFFPNPVADVLNIYSNSTISKIEIYSVDGKKLKVFYLNTKQASISLNGLAEGNYFVLAFSTDGSDVFHIIKDKK